MIFWTADFADEADFTQIEFLDAQAHELARIAWREASFPRRRESHNLLWNLLHIYLKSALAEHAEQT